MEEDKSSSNITENLNALKAWKNGLQKSLKAHETVINNINYISRAIRYLTKNSYEIDNNLKEIVSLQEFFTDFEDFQKFLIDIQSIISKEKVKFQMRFYDDLKSVLEGEKITIIGNPPNLILPPFQLDVEMETGFCKLLLGREIVSTKIPLDPDKIIKIYKKSYKEICERAFDPDKFIEDLFKAYNKVLNLKQHTDQKNLKMNIIDVLNELVFIIQDPKFHRTHLKDDFKSYPRNHFLYDIIKLQESRKLEYKEFKLSFTSATIDTTGKIDKMLYLPNLRGDTRPIMAIEFLEIKK